MKYFTLLILFSSFSTMLFAQETSIKDSILFHFSVKELKNELHELEIKGVLTNSSSDTLFFNSSSCNGDRDLVIYDKKNYTRQYHTQCFVDLPITQKIAPGKTHHFTVFFIYRQKIEKTSLGFQICSNSNDWSSNHSECNPKEHFVLNSTFTQVIK